MTLTAEMPSRRSVLFAMTAMTLSAACWGFATVMTKGALGAVPPFTLLAIQLTSSVTFLWLAVVLTRTGFRLDARARRAATTGLLEPGLAYGVGVPGLALTTAANASVIGATEPALIVLVAWLFLRQRSNPLMLFALVIVMAGIALVTVPDFNDLGRGNVQGDVMVLLGTVFAALYVVASARFVVHIPALPLAALQQSVGLAAALAFLVGAIASGWERLPVAISWPMVLLAVGSGIVQYALAFWLYLLGIKSLRVSVAGMFLGLIPVFGIFGAIAFLDESLVASQAAGALMIVSAVALIARRSV